MSILLTKPRPINPAAEPVLVFAGDPPSAGEPIPARSDLSPADLESIVRFGFVGDEPVEPVRLSRVQSPSQAESLAQSTALKLAGPRESISPYMVGAYRSMYAELYQHYLDTRAELKRARTELAFWPERAEELADAASYGTHGYNS